MPLTDLQKAAIRLALVPVLPQLRRAAPPERAQLLREALERAGANPTWAEWEAYAGDVLAEADEAHGD
jgi:hypothetical protein